MRNRISLAMPFLILLFFGIAVQNHSAYATEPAVVKVVNPLTGHEWFNFIAENKTVGDTFVINIQLYNVTDLGSAQIMLTWNQTMLNYFGLNVPPNAIFPEPIFDPIINPDVSVPGRLIYGEAFGPNRSFTGDGILFQIEFKIAAYGETLLHIDPYPSDNTFLTDINRDDMSFTTVDGHYVLPYSALKGDVNDDGVVNATDISLVVTAFNSYPNMLRWNVFADLDGNGHVDMRDVAIVILNFSKTS
jgi:hypothetical protein